jgi:hypothetical protein
VFWTSHATTSDDFDKAVTRSRPASEVVDAMMDRYGSYGNPYTLHLAAATQFGGE